MQISHYLPRELPEALQDLALLALDLRWSWHHGTDELWRRVDRELWQSMHNPWLILETVSDQRLQELARDEEFLAALQACLEERRQHFQAPTWFDDAHDDQLQGQVAYFSMEFGISESLPIYSGGLGVLAGDHLKTCCDLDVPLVGVGLLYQQGYFRQSLDVHGEQLEFYPYNDPTMLPVVPLRDDDGEWVHIHIPLPGRSLRLRAWHAQVGRRSLLLLDSNDMRNQPGDRSITGELYGGGPELRLQQELVLGIGGWRLLERLGLACPVCHLNEGHAAFAILERARHFMQRNQVSFDEALTATRAGNLFTTHTPVKAGFDRFAPELMGMYLQDYAAELGISLEALLALGRANPDDASESFNMAYLAVRGAAAVNGVSRLHGEVSRRIFQPLFPHWPRDEVPVDHITNGVHVPTWDSEAADRLWTRACGQSRWRGELDAMENQLRELPDDTLWEFRAQQRRSMIDYLRQRLVRQHSERGATESRIRACSELLDPDALTLGFARRFAEYKRTNLLLQDPERLARLLTSRDRPVQLVLAGKAHPQDREGKQRLHQWQAFLEREDMHGRVVFVEDYDLVVAAHLIQGVDVWINTPRRPWEASGTSGMKVLVNGGLNLSELDGWWAEAYSSKCGWALGDGREHEDVTGWDRAEAEQLFGVLENEVIPAFYQRDNQGLPRDWIGRIRESMAGLTGRFSSNRMLREYAETYYLPLAQAYRQRSQGEARAIQAWRQHLAQHWQRIHFGNVTWQEQDGEYHFTVQAYLDDLAPEDVRVQLYADADDKSSRSCIDMARDNPLAGSQHAYVYHARVTAQRPVTDFTPRIIPNRADVNIPMETGYILWYR